jgi:hypothetical protein
MHPLREFFTTRTEFLPSAPRARDHLSVGGFRWALDQRRTSPRRNGVPQRPMPTPRRSAFVYAKERIYLTVDANIGHNFLYEQMMTWSSQVASDVLFPILGRRFRARAVGPELEGWLRREWGLCETPMEPHRFEIDLALRAEAPRSLAIAPRLALTGALDGSSVVWLRHGDRWWSAGVADAGIELRLFDDSAHIRVWNIDETHGFERHEIRSALDGALNEAMRTSGLVPIRAAIVAQGARATALLGAGGVGRSVLRALDAGWTSFARASAWLDPETARVYAWDRTPRVNEEARRRIRARGWRRSSPEGVVSFGDTAPVTLVSRCAELTRIAVVTHDVGRDSSVEALSTRDAVRALWESAGVTLCSRNRNEFAAQLPGLLARLEAMRLIVGRTPVALP